MRRSNLQYGRRIICREGEEREDLAKRMGFEPTVTRFVHLVYDASGNIDEQASEVYIQVEKEWKTKMPALVQVTGPEWFIRQTIQDYHNYRARSKLDKRDAREVRRICGSGIHLTGMSLNPGSDGNDIMEAERAYGSSHFINMYLCSGEDPEDLGESQDENE